MTRTVPDLRPLRLGPAFTLAWLSVAVAGCLGGASRSRWRLVPTQASPLPGIPRANAIGVGDFDRDGRTDLAVLGGAGELLVLLNRGEGLFEPSS